MNRYEPFAQKRIATNIRINLLGISQQQLYTEENS